MQTNLFEPYCFTRLRHALRRLDGSTHLLCYGDNTAIMKQQQDSKNPHATPQKESPPNHGDSGGLKCRMNDMEETTGIKKSPRFLEGIVCSVGATVAPTHLS